MSPPTLIVCERAPLWASALRRTKAAAGLRLRETRNLPECGELLAAAPASFAMLELEPSRIDAVLNFLGRLERDYPQARAAVLASRELAAYEWLARELGAVDFRAAPRWLERLVEVAARHLARARPPEASYEERIIASLPWGSSS